MRIKVPIDINNNEDGRVQETIDRQNPLQPLIL